MTDRKTDIQKTVILYDTPGHKGCKTGVQKRNTMVYPFKEPNVTSWNDDIIEQFLLL